MFFFWFLDISDMNINLRNPFLRVLLRLNVPYDSSDVVGKYFQSFLSELDDLSHLIFLGFPLLSQGMLSTCSLVVGLFGLFVPILTDYWGVTKVLRRTDFLS